MSMVAFQLSSRADAPITGGISIVGFLAANGPLETATAFIGFNAVEAGSATGSYSSVPNHTTVRLNPFAFDSQPSSPFRMWAFTNSGKIYTFDMTSVSIFSQGSGPAGTAYLNLIGAGMGHVTGFADTPESFVLAANRSFGGLTSFSVSFGAQPVPQLAIFLTSSNSIAIYWPTNSPGYFLQQNTNLTTTNWVSVTNSVTILDTNNQVVVSSPAGIYFYRLLHP
jgi:hypothetical protein